MLAKAKQDLVTDWQGSGLTKSAYCRERGLNLKTFSRWCGRMQTEGSTVAKLMPVKIVSDTGAAAVIRLKLPCGGWLEMPKDTSARWLGELLRCLG